MFGSKPHGGKLISNVYPKDRSSQLLEQLQEFLSITLDNDAVMDVEKIAIGAFSPIDGFMGSQDYDSVLKTKRLSSGSVWTLPIVLPVSLEQASKFSAGDEIALTDSTNRFLATLKLDEKYTPDKKEECRYVFNTVDPKHPGVSHTHSLPPVYLGGRVTMVQRPILKFPEYELTPQETRDIFSQRKWKTVVAFHTRNPPHRAHEYLQKCALEIVDGLLIHPVIGRKKPGDFPPEAIIAGYNALFDAFYPKNRAVLGALSTYSRYAGPREAVFTALVRKNFGATHFIVGRDHTGVGNFYHKYASHEIFDEFTDEELGVHPLRFRGPSHCTRCASITTDKTCPHGDDLKMEISGSEVRSLFNSGKFPPEEFMRKEVAEAVLKVIKG